MTWEEAKAYQRRLSRAIPASGRPLCKGCHKRLTPSFSWKWAGTTTIESVTHDGFGYLGNSHFCTLHCAFSWAMRKLNSQ